MNRKGATLPLVIVILIVITAMLAVIGGVIATSAKQTAQLTNFIQSKYVAVSGSQLAMGAYYAGGPRSDLFLNFRNAAEGRRTASVVTSTHDFEAGRATITISGKFIDNKPRTVENYEITIESKAKVPDVPREYYVHTVTFNFHTNGIRRESGGTILE